MRVIGIDPGIEKTGFAILEQQNGILHFLDGGCIFTNKKDAFSYRLHALALDLKKLLRQWKPTAAGLEEIFFSKNVKTAIKVSHARGVILETLEAYEIPVVAFNPAHVKIAVTGDGKADKKQIQKMIQYLLGIKLRNDDTADAMACGICLFRGKTAFSPAYARSR